MKYSEALAMRKTAADFDWQGAIKQFAPALALGLGSTALGGMVGGKKGALLGAILGGAGGWAANKYIPQVQDWLNTNVWDKVFTKIPGLNATMPADNKPTPTNASGPSPAVPANYNGADPGAFGTQPSAIPGWEAPKPSNSGQQPGESGIKKYFKRLLFGRKTLRDGTPIIPV